MNKLQIGENDKILILAPHADDDSIGCGGLIGLYPKQIDVILLTDGRYGGINLSEDEIVKIRAEEFRNAMDYAGVNSYKSLQICDGKLKSNFKGFKAIDFKKYKYVFIPNENEQQKDHHVVLDFVLKSNINKNTIIAQYEVWTPLLNPTHYINLSNSFKEKYKLVSFYKSQNDCHKYTYYVEGLNKYRGILANIDYAECFNLEYFGILQIEKFFRKRIFNVQKCINGKLIIYIFCFKITI